MYELEQLESDLYQVEDSAEVRSGEEAIQFYKSLCKSVSSSASSFVASGDGFRSFDMFEQAINAYGVAIRKNAGYLPAYIGRGELYFELALAAPAREVMLRYGASAVDDFRVAMMVSLGSADIVWRLGTALLVVGDAAGARALAENCLVKSDRMRKRSKRDFLYLLGFGKLFGGDLVGAEWAFAEMAHTGVGCAEAIFGRLVVCLVSGNVIGVKAELDQLEIADRTLWEAGCQLESAGCTTFVQVAQAIFGLQHSEGS
jgi:hypothetical protein